MEMHDRLDVTTGVNTVHTEYYWGVRFRSYKNAHAPLDNCSQISV